MSNKTKMWNEYDRAYSFQLFKPYCPWRYPINWWKNISWFFRSFKYAWQRVRRGYSDYDLIDLGDYIVGISAQALEDFAEKTCSYPGEYIKYNSSEDTDEGFEKWKDELRSCSLDLFQSLECLEDFNYQVPEMPGELIFKDNSLQHVGAEKEEIDKWLEKTNEIAHDRLVKKKTSLCWLSNHIEELWI